MRRPDGSPVTREDYAKIYQEIHQNEKFFAGKVRGTEAVVRLVERCRPRRILDYGSGKGYQYLLERQHEKWGGLLPVCYDIGVRQLARRPEGTFDGIICCDMMEHIAEYDVDAVLEDIFSFVSDLPSMHVEPQAEMKGIVWRGSPITRPDIVDEPEEEAPTIPVKAFVYFHISCIPSTHKRLPDGRDVHLTIRPPDWWNGRLKRFRRPGLIIEAAYETDREVRLTKAEKRTA